jgi:transcriptional regulator with XRE-family HTH domain
MEESRENFDPQLRERLATRVRARRAQLKMSQETLSAKCGFHRTYVSQVERGVTNISLDNLERIAHALGVDPHLLLMPVARSAEGSSKK